MKKNFTTPGKLYDLVDDYKSPLFRIMSIIHHDDAAKRGFGSNICCVHVGNGYFISVSHVFKSLMFGASIDAIYFEPLVKNRVAGADKLLIEKHYIFDKHSNQYNLQNLPTGKNESEQVQGALFHIFEKLNVTLESAYNANAAKPFLIVEFKENEFYHDGALTKKFNLKHVFRDSVSNRFNFLIELKLVNSFTESDIALYKAVNIDQEFIDKLPSIEIDYSFYDNNSDIKFLFLQPSPNPSSNLGRMVSDAKIEGVIEHWSKGHGFLFEGKRYLSQNYFRFGSSGAPYLVYDSAEDKVYVNAIQSEAAALQMLIGNNRDGNQQYTHAIASPLFNIREQLQEIIFDESLDELKAL